MTLNDHIARARTSDEATAHKRRVTKVQSILFDLCRGAIPHDRARFALEAAGLAPEAATALVDSARRNIR